MNKTVSVRLPVEDIRFFQEKYPYMFSQFVRKAVEKALASRDFFEYTLFEDSDSTFKFGD